MGDEITPPAPVPVLGVGPDPSDCPRGDEGVHMDFSAGGGDGCPPPRQPRTPRSPTAPSPYTEDYPARADVAAAMRAVAPAIRACGDGQEWDHLTVSIFFTSDGSVARVRVWRGFETIPLGQCVAVAARNARLPPFRIPRFGVTFPFALGR